MKKYIPFLLALIVCGAGFAYQRFSNLNPQSSQAPAAAPAFTPSLHLVTRDDGKPGFAENPFVTSPAAPEPWLLVELIDPAKQPPAGEQAPPDNLRLLSKAEPVITKDGATWKITFKP